VKQSALDSRFQLITKHSTAWDKLPSLEGPHQFLVLDDSGCRVRKSCLFPMLAGRTFGPVDVLSLEQSESNAIQSSASSKLGD